MRYFYPDFSVTITLRPWVIKPSSLEAVGWIALSRDCFFSSYFLIFIHRILWQKGYQIKIFKNTLQWFLVHIKILYFRCLCKSIWIWKSEKWYIFLFLCLNYFALHGRIYGVSIKCIKVTENCYISFLHSFGINYRYLFIYLLREIYIFQEATISRLFCAFNIRFYRVHSITFNVNDHF